MLDDWPAAAVFYLLAGVTLTAAIATVTVRNPVRAAICFGLALLGTAGLLLFQGAQFLAMATLLVYAGAILVACLVVLTSARSERPVPDDRMGWGILLPAFSVAVLVGILLMTVTGVLADAEGPGPPVAATVADRSAEIPAHQPLARLGSDLFGKYLIAVEVTGTLLLAALVGAGVILGGARAAEPGPDGGRSEGVEPGKKARGPDE